jgi:hypothetical protein
MTLEEKAVYSKSNGKKPMDDLRFRCSGGAASAEGISRDGIALFHEHALQIGTTTMAMFNGKTKPNLSPTLHHWIHYR